MRNFDRRIFFTADTHFQHEAILCYCHRPFASCADMDAALVENWNTSISDDDMVYHLGDVFFGDPSTATRLLAQLKGKKFLIPGNHDSSTRLSILKEHFTILPPLYTHKFRSKNITLCHYAMLSWDKDLNGALMLHGHTHGALTEHNQRLDVGVDCWDFSPVSLEQVLQKLQSLPPKLSEGKERT